MDGGVKCGAMEEKDIKTRKHNMGMTRIHKDKKPEATDHDRCSKRSVPSCSCCVGRRRNYIFFHII